MQKSYGPFIAAAVVVLITAAFILAPSNETTEQAISELVNEQTIAKVQVKASKGQMVDDILRATGETKANRIGNIHAESSGKVINVLKSNGDFVKTNEVIATIDAADLYARLESAKASEEQYRLQYQANLKLKNEGLQNKTSLAQTYAAYQQAKASHKSMQIQIDNLTIRAPFAGIVEQLSIEQGSFTTPGMLIGQVYDFSPLLVSTEISENQIAAVQVGDKISVELISGEQLNGQVSFLSANANKNTRTFYTEMTITDQLKQPKAGVTAKIELSLKTALAHKVSPALLQLDKTGALGIKVLDEQQKVEFKTVSIVKSETDGSWITGLGENANIITVGQSFVSEGESVQPEFNNDSRSGEQ